MEHTYRLVIACPDRVGIVAKVSQFIAQHGGWVTDASYHADQDVGWFYMRNEIKADSIAMNLEEFKRAFQKIAEEFQMEWFINDSIVRKKVAILASHASHCLADLLHRWHAGDLFCDIPCVIANHENLREMVEWHDIPFHYVPFEKDKKKEAFAEVDKILENYATDTIVLARFMQILPSEICEKYSDRVINIHHSFLPSFIGANPYQKAYDRGVKLIGATCHFVTPNLDEGPIIEQDVVRVSHRHTKEDMVRLGKDVEKMVLARGVEAHLLDRVIVHGNKTIVLD
ncbi:MAG: formyltetrahydrofolate deformylase [Pseudomonadales bacterium]|nr:formyltetrahydrofolate deformylase [Pseudomonadales bacterium]